jgi:hypothetical protein
MLNRQKKLFCFRSSLIEISFQSKRSEFSSSASPPKKGERQSSYTTTEKILMTLHIINEVLYYIITFFHALLLTASCFLLDFSSFASVLYFLLALPYIQTNSNTKTN